MKKQSRFMQDTAGTSPVTGAVAVIAVLALFVGAGLISIERGDQAAPPPGAAFPAAGAPAPAAAPSALTVDQMVAANNGLTQTVDITTSLTDITAGSGVTTGTFVWHKPDQYPENPNAPNWDTSTPGTQDTTRAIRAGAYVKGWYSNDPAYYPVSLFPDPRGWQYVGVGKLPIAPNPQVAVPSGGIDLNVRRVASLAGMNEGATTDARGVNIWNGQTNTSRSNDGCIVMNGADNQTPAITNPNTANGDRVGIQNEACSGTFYIIPTYSTGVDANRWIYRPVFCARDPFNNRSGDEFTSIGLSIESSNPFLKPQLNDIRQVVNTNQCVKFYEESNPWIPSGNNMSFRLQFSYSNSLWSGGEGLDLYFEDLDDVNGWWANTSTRGASGQSILLRKLGDLS